MASWQKATVNGKSSKAVRSRRMKELVIREFSRFEYADERARERKAAKVRARIKKIALARVAASRNHLAPVS